MHWVSPHLRSTAAGLFRGAVFALGLIAVAPAGAAGPSLVDKVSALKPGMTPSDVAGVLGAPTFTVSATESRCGGEAWYYRFPKVDDVVTTGAKSGLGRESRIRCVFKDGKLARISGWWPAPTPPPTTVPKEKILLVDVLAVYDGLKATRAINARLLREGSEDQRQLDQLRGARNLLAADCRLAEQAAERSGASAAQKRLSEQRVKELRQQIDARQREIDQFMTGTRTRPGLAIDRFRDLMLPAIAGAILTFKAERGYEYVFELNENVLSAGVEPVRVAGVDGTAEIVKWIDAGGAKEAGL